MTKRKKGGMVPINPAWYDEWRALPCLLARPKDCAYNVFSFLGLLSLEQAQKFSNLSPEGADPNIAYELLQERYPGVVVASVEQDVKETFQGFIDRIFPQLHNGYAYMFYFYRADGSGHVLVVYKNNNILYLVDPQVSTLSTISQPDDILTYIQTVPKPPPIRLGVIIPDHETPPTVEITETIRKRSIGATVEQVYVSKGVGTIEAKVAGQEASMIDWDTVRSNVRIKQYSLTQGEPGSVADNPYERAGLGHLHQVCFGKSLPTARLENNFLIAYADKKVVSTYVYASMLLVHLDSPEKVTLYSVCTDPNFRGRGFLTGLLKTLEQHITATTSTITTYELDCAIETFNRVTFLQRFNIYTHYGFRLKEGIVVRIQQLGPGGELHNTNVRIQGSEYEFGLVKYNCTTEAGVRVQISYQSIIDIPLEQEGLVHGVAAKMVVSRNELRVRLGLDPLPVGAGAAEPGGAGAGAEMNEEVHAGGRRKRLTRRR